MLTTIIKYLFIYFFGIFIYSRSTSTHKISILTNFIISFILSTLTYLLKSYITGFNKILPLLLLWIVISILNSKPQITFVLLTISYTISMCLCSIANLIAIVVFLPILRLEDNLILLALITGIIQTLMVIALFSIKRFKKGIPFIPSSKFIDSITILSLLLISFSVFLSIEHRSDSLEDNALFIYLFALAFLIYWWQAQITKAYRRSLELRELESLRTEVAELNQLIEKLRRENERLAQITHRDNTLIRTLKNSTESYLMTEFKDSSEAIATRDQLLRNINTLSEGRSHFVEQYQDKKARHFDTGVSLLDELLHHMDGEALAKGITFSVHMGTVLTDFVPAVISEEDLVHTVDDLLKNAFKATASCQRRNVQLQFFKLGKHFVLEVADNGIPFEVESIALMGIEKRTTYEDGSGIGLMDIWSTKQKYGATYHMEEYAGATAYTKKISLTFDKKNRYSIRTWRKDDILKTSTRIDLQVYPHNE